MSSLCIKTNNEDILKYLKDEFSNFNMLNIVYSCNEFKSYKNIIIHYKGIDTELFYTKIATILSYIVIDFFEEKLIKNILNSNYFYFDNSELSKIKNMCIENLSDGEDFSLENRQILLFDAFYEYITTHHSIILTGFINFRLFKYKNLLEDLIDLSVNEFIIEREYVEFVSLLKLYVESQPCIAKIIHVVFSETDTFLLDSNINLINIDKALLNSKYLSDISFSSNDYVLNTLLNLLPEKIFLHVTSSINNLDFINTLQLIFTDRIEICDNCEICNLYKHLHVKK